MLQQTPSRIGLEKNAYLLSPWLCFGHSKESIDHETSSCLSTFIQLFGVIDLLSIDLEFRQSFPKTPTTMREPSRAIDLPRFFDNAEERLLVPLAVHARWILFVILWCLGVQLLFDRAHDLWYSLEVFILRRQTTAIERERKHVGSYLQIGTGEVRVVHDHEQCSFDGCRSNGILDVLGDLNQTKSKSVTFDSYSQAKSLTFRRLESCCSVSRSAPAWRNGRWRLSPDTIRNGNCTFPDWPLTSPSIRSDWIRAEDRCTFESNRRGSSISPSVRRGKRHHRATVSDSCDDRWSSSDVSVAMRSHGSWRSIGRGRRGREWIYEFEDNERKEWHEWTEDSQWSSPDNCAVWTMNWVRGYFSSAVVSHHRWKKICVSLVLRRKWGWTLPFRGDSEENDFPLVEIISEVFFQWTGELFEIEQATFSTALLVVPIFWRLDWRSMEIGFRRVSHHVLRCRRWRC